MTAPRTHSDTVTLAVGDRWPGTSVIGGLIRLRAALAVLDATDPDTDSISFDRATDRLIATVREVVTTAEPVLASPRATAAAVRDALARGRIASVPPGRECGPADAGPCGGHP